MSLAALVREVMEADPFDWSSTLSSRCGL